jgi:hypothetical protein
VDIKQFLSILLENLSKLEFVDKIDIQTEVFILKGRAILKKNRFVQIYFNELTGTTAFAIIEKDIRIWGIDYDNMRTWHLHPLENPDTHNEISPKTVAEIIDMISKVWIELP